MTETQIHISFLSNFHSVNSLAVVGTRSLKTAPVKSLEGSWNFELTHIGISWVSVFL